MIFGRRKKPPRIAMALCVQNERRFLAQHLAYHRALGVERAYVFGDRSTDGSLSVAANHPWVETFEIPGEQGSRFAYISDPQRACMDFSLVRAREEGFDWLLFIDPDEFIGSSRDQWTGQDPWLPQLLASVSEEIVMARFDVREALPLHEPGLPWHESHIYFQHRDPVPRRISHIAHQQEVVWNDFLGHRQGKCFVRTRARVQAYDAHRWTVEQFALLPEQPEYVALATQSFGWIHHFLITSHAHWRSKYRSFQHEPAHWFCNSPVETPKQWWKEISLRPESETARYYEDCVAVSRGELEAWLQQGLIMTDTSVRDFIRTLPASDNTPSPGIQARAVNFQKYLDSETLEDALAVLDYPVGSLRRRDLIDFYHLELHRDALFRWSGPDAAIRLRLGPGVYSARLDTGGMAPNRQLARVRLKTAERGWNVTSTNILGQKLEFKLEIAVGSAGEAWLKLDSPPITLPPGEKRRLCLPFFGLKLAPIPHA
jgi:hypothetical protein